MPKVQTTAKVDWNIDFAQQYDYVKPLFIFIDETDYRTSKKEGLAFTTNRAEIFYKVNWLNKGPVSAGNIFNFMYLNALGQMVKVGEFNFSAGLLGGEPQISGRFDLTTNFLPANYGINVFQITSNRGIEFPGIINNYTATLNLVVTYGV